VFAKALRKVSNYTLPVIISKRLVDGTVQCSCGTFIVVNSDGWFVTAAHIFDDFLQSQKDTVEIGAYEAAVQQIQADLSLNSKAKRKQLSRLTRKAEWIRTHSLFWGGLPASAIDVALDPIADLAVGRLEPFSGNSIIEYPVFRNPAGELPHGSSLCRLGFPFHSITATFDQGINQFILAPGVLPIPRFPNDGIHTRVVIIPSPDGSRQAKFIETSTPGLRGQSGGPIFDADANVWAIQSRTMSLPLGFSPVVKQGNKEITEHQFMHVGWGSHVEEVVRMLTDRNIKFSLSP
jgi:hypothetical protein